MKRRSLRFIRALLLGYALAWCALVLLALWLLAVLHVPVRQRSAVTDVAISCPAPVTTTTEQKGITS